MNVPLPFPTLICPTDIQVTVWCNRELWRIFISYNGVARNVINTNWIGKSFAVGGMAKHDVAPAILALNKGEIKPVVTVVDNSRIKLSVGRSHLPVIVLSWK